MVERSLHRLVEHDITEVHVAMRLGHETCLVIVCPLRRSSFSSGAVMLQQSPQVNGMIIVVKGDISATIMNGVARQSDDTRESALLGSHSAICQLSVLLRGLAFY